MQTSTKVLLGVAAIGVGAFIYMQMSGGDEKEQKKQYKKLPTDQKSLYDAAVDAAKDLAAKSLGPAEEELKKLIIAKWNASSSAASGKGSDSTPAPIEIGDNLSANAKAYDEAFFSMENPPAYGAPIPGWSNGGGSGDPQYGSPQYNEFSNNAPAA